MPERLRGSRAFGDSEALVANTQHMLPACRSSHSLHPMGLFVFQGVRGCFAQCTSRSVVPLANRRPAIFAQQRDCHI